jgi:nitrite reductase/ring-hydroxylating ferredoxin subunit
MIQQKKVDTGHSGKKMGKDFMNILANKFLNCIHKLSYRLIFVVVVLAACSSDLSDDEIPLSHFPDIIINLSLPSNIVLASKGGYKTIDDGGVRGIIVYCEDVGIYHAYERNCSYSPNDACATVDVDISKLFMIDHCCGSQFNFTTGEPIGGVAWRPLRKFQTIANGSELIITETIIN